MITVTYYCSGCPATATAEIRRHFLSFSGKDYGLGVYKVDNVESVAPEGWVPFDPYTSVTYCPNCWADITDGTTEEKQP